jgi:hypothetical protein
MPAHSTNAIADALSGEIQFHRRIRFDFQIRDRQYQNDYLAGLMEAHSLAQREPVEYLLREIVIKSEATSSHGKAAGLRSARLMLACAAASALRATNARPFGVFTPNALP